MIGLNSDIPHYNKEDISNKLRNIKTAKHLVLTANTPEKPPYCILKFLEDKYSVIIKYIFIVFYQTGIIPEECLKSISITIPNSKRCKRI